MPRSSAQSDFVVARPVPEEVEVVLPAEANPVRLPKALLVSNEASERSTKWVMRFTWLVLAILLLLTAIGPHIPSGE